MNTINTTEPGSYAFSRLAGLVVSAMLILFSQLNANGTTYYSSYGQSRTENITAVAGAHTFEVDGIAANKWTEWYVNGVYTGSAQNDYSGIFAIDPDYSYTFSSGTTVIKALVYNSDFSILHEYHIWNVTVPPKIYFFDARIANKLDVDGDGYAREFDIQFDVDSDSSTLSTSYYVRIYEYDGGALVDDYLTSSSIYNVIGNASDYRTVHIRCKDYPGSDYLSHGTAEFKLELYRASDSALVQTWTPNDRPGLGSVNVELESEDLGPTLARSPSSLTPTVTQGQNANSQSFDVWNSGGGVLSYSISDDASWLSVSPTSSTSTGEHDAITVNYTTAGLVSGNYNAGITITANGASGSPQTVNVSLTVNPPPFIPYFQDARITGKVDKDGDGYAQQFSVEFDVNSNVAGNYYVKIYEYDGGALIDDYLVTSPIFGVSGIGNDYHSVTIVCDNWPGADLLSHGTAEIKLELYNAANNQLVQTWTPGNDSDLGSVLVELGNEDLLPDPYGVGVLEPTGVGLFSTIPVVNRNNLTDLANLKNGGLYYNGRLVNSTDRKLIIVIHGWRSSPGGVSAITDAIAASAGTDRSGNNWRVIGYDWSNDAATGLLLGASTKSTLPKTTTVLVTNELTGVVTKNLIFEDNATEAAERAYQHGLLLGAKILQQVGANNLDSVHLVGHSAGSWMVYGALRYLYANAPSKTLLQATYLDPYIPGEIILNNNPNFNITQLASSPNFCRVVGQFGVKAEQYWSDSELEDGSFGTDTPLPWTSTQGIVFRTDGFPYGDAHWNGHGGPVVFYADTVNAPGLSEASGHGWKHSLAYNDYRALEKTPPGPADFGTVTVNGSVTGYVHVRNSGRTPIPTVSAITSIPFQVNSTVAAALQPGSEVMVPVTFHPMTVGFQTGTLTLSGDFANSPLAVQLSGTGIDAVSPVVSIGSPTSNPTYATSSSTIALSGNSSDNVSVAQVTWSNNRGGSGTANGTTSWMAIGIVLQSGVNVLTVTAWDLSGNSGTDTLTVNYTPDAIAPTVAITSPTSNPFYQSSSSTINVSGTANDNIGVTQVTWGNNRGGNGTASGTASWSLSGVTLQSGTNIITVTAWDATGNKGSDILTVLYTPPDTQGPFLTITSPSNGSTLTGPNLTVSGTATDNGCGNHGIASVIVNGVNATGASASGANTANWTAHITLAPGLNTITATATDSLGNSTIQQISITYNPPETSPPTLVIISPENNTIFTNASLTVSGTATDSGSGDNGIASVAVNGVAASGGSANGANTANWSATITLSPGPNTISVVARDSLNNQTTQQLTVTYNPPPCSATLLSPIPNATVIVPPTFIWSFNGTCSNKVYIATNPVPEHIVVLSNAFFSGTNSLTITATRWSNVVASLGESQIYYWTVGNADIQQGDLFAEWQPFTISTNPPPVFVPISATYSGLFYEPMGVTYQSSGFFTAKTTRKGTFSAKLRLAGRSYSFSGQFSETGASSKSIPRSGLNPLTVQLQFDLASSDVLTGQISDGIWTSELTADRSTYNSKFNPAPQAGKYTLLIPGNENTSTAPGGDGFGTVVVDKSGNLTFSGALSDGSKVSQKAVLSQDGHWPFYLSLYSGNGLILGWLTFTNGSTDDLDGLIDWIKLPQPAAKLYPLGFTNQAETVGSRYSFTDGVRVLNINTGQLWLARGNLTQGFTNRIALGTNNKVSNQSSNKLSLTITTSSGVFKGSAVDPATGKAISISGAVLQKQNLASGYFLGTNQSGRVFLEPAP